MFPPLVAEMIGAMADSLESLRSRVSNVCYGPILGGVQYIRFDLDGKTKVLPMDGERANYLLGFGEERDRRIAVRCLLR